MRTLKELLEILIESLKKGHKEGFYNMGICGEIEDLIKEGYSIEEYRRLIYYVKRNRPSETKHPEFYSRGERSPFFWWYKMKVFPETRQIRIDFLTKLLNTLDETEIYNIGTDLS